MSDFLKFLFNSYLPIMWCDWKCTATVEAPEITYMSTATQTNVKRRVMIIVAGLHCVQIQASLDFISKLKAWELDLGVLFIFKGYLALMSLPEDTSLDFRLHGVSLMMLRKTYL